VKILFSYKKNHDFYEFKLICCYFFFLKLWPNERFSVIRSFGQFFQLFELRPLASLLRPCSVCNKFVRLFKKNWRRTETFNINLWIVWKTLDFYWDFSYNLEKRFSEKRQSLQQNQPNFINKNITCYVKILCLLKIVKIGAKMNKCEFQFQF
jgi:hypothetical protein